MKILFFQIYSNRRIKSTKQSKTNSLSSELSSTVRWEKPYLHRRELDKTKVNENSIFTVGDGKIYNPANI